MRQAIRRVRTLERRHLNRGQMPSFPIHSLGLSEETQRELKAVWDGENKCYRVADLPDKALDEIMESRPWAQSTN